MTQSRNEWFSDPVCKVRAASPLWTLSTVTESNMDL